MLEEEEFSLKTAGDSTSLGHSCGVYIYENSFDTGPII
jgi:hypothetical protein